MSRSKMSLLEAHETVKECVDKPFAFLMVQGGGISWIKEAIILLKVSKTASNLDKGYADSIQQVIREYYAKEIKNG